MLTSDWDGEKRKAELEAKRFEEKRKRLEAVDEGLDRVIDVVRHGDGDRQFRSSKHDVKVTLQCFLRSKGIYL